jgi:hypothetical protein
LELRAKSADISFDCKYAENYASQQVHYELSLDTTGIGATTGKVTLRHTNSGTAYATDVSQASAANVVSTINALTGLSATLIGAKAIAWGDLGTCTALDYDLVWNAARTTVIGSGTVLDSPDLLGSTKYPTLKPEDVYAEFAAKGNTGFLAGLIQTEKPTKDTYYVKYNFKTMIPTYDGVIPGGKTEEEFAFSLYIPLAVINAAANLFDASNYMWDADDTGFTADTTWVGLIAAWQA